MGQEILSIRVDINIVHNDPTLKYTGTVQPPGERTASKFSFEGAIDGKQYTVKDDNGDYQVKLTRKSDNVIEGLLIGADR